MSNRVTFRSLFSSLILLSVSSTAESSSLSGELLRSSSLVIFLGGGEVFVDGPVDPERPRVEDEDDPDRCRLAEAPDSDSAVRLRLTVSSAMMRKMSWSGFCWPSLLESP